MTIRFDGRVVVVTGAGGGLGRAYALAFAGLGARVVVNDRGGARDGSGASNTPAEAVAAEIAALGGEAMTDASDVTDRAAMAGLAGRVLARFGRVDVLVANAGILRDRSFAKMSPAEWDDVVAVHLGGAQASVAAVWPAMRDAGYGRILLTTSGSGLYGNFGQANYSAAKMALVGLMRTLAAEGEKSGIRVNAIAPVAWTRLTADLFPPGSETVFAVEKVVPGALYLTSEAAPNGMVLSAGAGVFAEARVVETPGLALGDAPDVDTLARRFAEVRAGDGAEPVANAMAQTVKLAARASRR